VPYTLTMGLVWFTLAFLLGLVVGVLLRSVTARRQVARARAATGDAAELERLRRRIADIEAAAAAPVEVVEPAASPVPAGATDLADLADLAEAEAVLGRPVVRDDLTVVEGLGVQVQELCHGIGIRTWRDLGSTEPSLLRTMLDDAGARFQIHDPSTWPEQARLLDMGAWVPFRELAESVRAGGPFRGEPDVPTCPISPMVDPVEFTLDGRAVAVPPTGSLLDALRERLGVTSVKDGCSPQGQCGCCTVLVDGQPRVSCVTPVGRVAGRSVTTVDGLVDADEWASAFTSTGASQCGFCTPGIVVRLAALDPAKRESPDAVRQALLAHLCRCTGWQTIVEAASRRPDGRRPRRVAGDRPRASPCRARGRCRPGRRPRTWRSAGAGSPTTERPTAPSWRCAAPAATGWWPRRSRKRAPPAARCRAAAPRRH
jgi:aerobic-type carbon monoxide dehydrogenase small subunit (CoxS/CutS family)/predicted flap endonuclease-1-like 5' DNA nuclease